MITYIKGDLFADNHPVIAHGCNCQGVMGSGIAKIVKEKFPTVFSRYKELCDSYHDKPWQWQHPLGHCQFLPIEGGRVIVNCFTQDKFGPGKQVSYDAVDSCMYSLAVFLEGTDEYLAMPKIGAGLGGGEWSIIEAIINYRLKDADVRIYEL